MPQFFFRSTDQDGFSAEDRGFEFPDSEAAIKEAKHALAEMAADGLPQEPVSMISIQVLDSNHVLVCEMRLVMEVIMGSFKPARD
ncbi:DUF6894 family protein [Rhizobium giardinii]|uniref:DUF6894 family protein n=1 Tax=Rhizobium giardinii TaxID=56731 RepID=UPI003D700658